MYINYVDFPTVPDELLDPVELIIKRVHTKHKTPEGIYVYGLCEINENLKNWLITNIGFEHHATYQLIYPPLPIHRDGNNTAIAINYLISLGGESPVTIIYNDELTELESMKIEPYKWHSIKTDLLHTVQSLTSPPRIALRLTPINY
jgi:hypothetical protein